MRGWLWMVAGLWAIGAQGQTLVVAWSGTQMPVNSTHLDPPVTAGADFEAVIPLVDHAEVDVGGVRDGTDWCLYVERQVPVAGAALLKLTPDAMTFPPGKIDLARTPPYVWVTLEMQPILSGSGSVSGVLIRGTLENASVATDSGLRKEDLLWTLSSGACPI